MSIKLAATSPEGEGMLFHGYPWLSSFTLSSSLRREGHLQNALLLGQIVKELHRILVLFSITLY